MRLVLDSSVALAWCFTDGRNPKTLALLEQVIEIGAIVPSLWRYEIANGLILAQRRKRIDDARRLAFLAELGQFDITVDRTPEGDPWFAASSLAALHGLTVYDAAYLEIAQRNRLPLATLDKALASAAVEAGVAVL